MKYNLNQLDPKKSLWKIFWGLIILGAIGIIAIILYCSSYCSSGFFKIFGESLLLAITSCGVGILLGLLFGNPKSSDSKQIDKEGNYTHNPNLEQISDWLTKIIVGVSLVEAGNIISYIKKLLNVLDKLFSGSSYQAYCLVILVFFLFYGFFLGYLCACLFLPGLFRFADGNAKEIAQKVVEDNSTKDANARILTEFLLSQGDIPNRKVEEKELIEAIKNTTPDIKSDIFFKACDFRRKCNENYKKWGSDPGKYKSEISKAIHVFNALIADDKDKNKEELQHAFNFVQLGYIYKKLGDYYMNQNDKIEAKNDYSKAKEMLSKAIEIRKSNRDHDYPADSSYSLPDFVRALCSIILEAEFHKDKNTEDSEISLIITDLTKAHEDIGSELKWNEEDVKAVNKLLHTLKEEHHAYSKLKKIIYSIKEKSKETDN